MNQANFSLCLAKAMNISKMRSYSADAVMEHWLMLCKKCARAIFLGIMTHYYFMEGILRCIIAYLCYQTRRILGLFSLKVTKNKRISEQLVTMLLSTALTEGTTKMAPMK